MLSLDFISVVYFHNSFSDQWFNLVGQSTSLEISQIAHPEIELANTFNNALDDNISIKSKCAIIEIFENFRFIA